ncbi:hypothetical protein Dsin_015692 [Dipteronia sinensis]|uniref:Uncharacterized protein n=1 Tax=Dipteronia sinensis TaxID=43782 RepID=A0AAE0ABN7_9ROSI|nr:hypothetical protein Dsin_015692 [Dipteronia sinensis]
MGFRRRLGIWNQNRNAFSVRRRSTRNKDLGWSGWRPGIEIPNSSTGSPPLGKKGTGSRCWKTTGANRPLMRREFRRPCAGILIIYSLPYPLLLRR